MKIAFCLHTYFPFGGQQRDFRRIALACQARGHQIVVYTFEWQGETCPGFKIIQVPKQGLSNHARNENFSWWIQRHRHRHSADLLVGFTKMAGLDIYFAADVCYAEKTARDKSWLYKLTPRYHSYMRAETAVFEQKSLTGILALTPQQISDFKQHYSTRPERFHLLPPGIDRHLYHPGNRQRYRKSFRREQGIPEQVFLLLQVGSDFRRKGVARSIDALAALPEDIKYKTQLWIVGADNPRAYQQQARRAGIESLIRFESGRDDIPQIMAAADLLLHPACQESAGIVLIEALASGLPVFATEVCGYAAYLAEAGNGCLFSEPFNQQQFNQQLVAALTDPASLSQWAQAAVNYSQHHDLYRLPEYAADIIEQRARDAATKTAI